MKKIYAGLFFLLSFSLTRAQAPAAIGPLTKNLVPGLPENNKMKITCALAHAYLWTDNDSALFYANQALQLARKLDNTSYQVLGGTWKFTAEGLMRKDLDAIKSFFITKEVAENCRVDSIKNNFIIYAGILYLNLKEYRKSLNILLADTSIFRGEFEGAYEVLAEAYYRNHKPDSAIKYINKAIAFYQKYDYKWSALPRVLGNSYRLNGDYDKALKELRKALYLANYLHDTKFDIIVANISLAQTFYEQGNYDSSLYYTKAALHSAGFNTFPDQQVQTFTLLKNLYKVKNNKDSVYKYTSWVLQMKDSIYSAEKIRAVQRLQLEQHLRMSEIEREKAVYENRVKLFVLIAILLFFLIVAFILYKNNRRKQKANTLLKRQKDKISNQKTALESTLQELQATQKKLILSEHKLKKLDHLKSRFFANISHEFRTPLTLLIGPLEDLMRGGDVKAFTEILPEMHRNSKRLLQLINQLLDLSRLDAGEYRINTTKEDIIPFVKQLVHSFSAMAHARNIRLETDIDPKLVKALRREEIVFYFDEDVVEKILTNLLSNAFKFTSDEGRIIVTLCLPEKTPGFLELKVEDDGAGIPPDKVPFVFDRFYRAGNGRSAGSGIGLALLKELVDLHGGAISVSSTEGKGSAFSCLLPLDKKVVAARNKVNPKRETAQPVIMDAPTETPRRKQRDEAERPIVLLVEDHRDVRRYVASRLKAEYVILEATDGEKGLQMAIDHVPDLVITDVMMPEMDGFELCTALKTDDRTSHIPVILLTARVEDTDKVTGLQTGADAYLIKPFSSQELLIRVKNLIVLRTKMRLKFSNRLVVRPAEVTVTSRDREFMQRLLKTVETHIADENFSVMALGKEVNMSVSQINRKLKATVNQSALQFIRSVRLQRAFELLQKNSGTIAEIAFQTGFEDPGYFSKVFKKHFGFLPSERSTFSK